ATLGLLESVNFQYRVEIGAPDGGAQGRFRYTDGEMASRLSYLLWDTTPDAALLQAAEAGQLRTPDGVRAQVTRLLQSDRAKVGIANFAAEMYQLDDLVARTGLEMRDTPSLRGAMADEVKLQFQARLADGADALDMLTTTKTWVNAELAAIHGIAGVTGTAMVPATFAPGQPRAGLLGMGAYLVMTGKGDDTSPTGRGKFIDEQILCRSVPDPPPDVDTNTPKGMAGTNLATRRQIMDAHRKDPQCAACHQLFDPLGYAFEVFDWVGAYRDKDHGTTIDPSGMIMPEGVQFKDALDLVGKLRKMPDVEQCLLKNIFRYAIGHHETDGDAPTLDAWV